MDQQDAIKVFAIATLLLDILQNHRTHLLQHAFLKLAMILLSIELLHQRQLVFPHDTFRNLKNVPLQLVNPTLPQLFHVKIAQSSPVKAKTEKCVPISFRLLHLVIICHLEQTLFAQVELFVLVLEEVAKKARVDVGLHHDDVLDEAATVGLLGKGRLLLLD